MASLLSNGRTEAAAPIPLLFVVIKILTGIEPSRLSDTIVGIEPSNRSSMRSRNEEACELRRSAREEAQGKNWLFLTGIAVGKNLFYFL